MNFCSSVKLNVFAKSPDIVCDVIFKLFIIRSNCCAEEDEKEDEKKEDEKKEDEKKKEEEEPPKDVKLDDASLWQSMDLDKDGKLTVAEYEQ